MTHRNSYYLLAIIGLGRDGIINIASECYVLFGWPGRTLERVYKVGKVLTPDMREVLRGSDLLNNQKQLEDLAGLWLPRVPMPPSWIFRSR